MKALSEYRDDAQVELAMRPHLAAGASKSAARTIVSIDFEKINYELIETAVSFIDQKFYKIDGAILVFLPGLAEIQRCMEELMANPKLAQRCVFYNLHSSSWHDRAALCL